MTSRQPVQRGFGGARRVDRLRSSERPIVFGTSGWRGRLGEEVTFPRLRVLVRSVADWLIEQEQTGAVLIGWDHRFASEEMAETAAALLVEAGLVPILSAAPLPTPAVTSALSRGEYAGGLVLTASHNPPLDHGLKVFSAWGGTIPESAVRRIEAIAAARMQDDGPARAAVPHPDSREDLAAAYHRRLAATLGEVTRPVTVVYDAMHGTGAGVLDAVLEEAGARVVRRRCEVDPRFGGEMPDPNQENLAGLSGEVLRQSGPRMGLATDGDGDRVGVVDGRGRVLSETEVVALLIHSLAGEGLIEKGAALTEGTGSLAARVAESHGLRVDRHPIGFKHLSASLRAEHTDVAGEESGGFAWRPFGYDKDGLLAGCLLLRHVMQTGESLEAELTRFEAEFGSSACGRSSVPRLPSAEQALEALQTAPPRQVDGVPVLSAERTCGLRLHLADGGFLLFRASGTEARIRIYGEAPNRESLTARLAAAAALLC